MKQGWQERCIADVICQWKPHDADKLTNILWLMFYFYCLRFVTSMRLISPVHSVLVRSGKKWTKSSQ